MSGVRAERLVEARRVADAVIDMEQAPATASPDFAITAAAPIAASIPGFVRDGGKVASTVQTPDAAARGGLGFPIARRYPLVDIADALRTLSAQPRDKVVILPMQSA